MVKAKSDGSQKKKYLTLSRKRGLNGLWFVLPFILGLLGLYLNSLIQTYIFATSDIDIGPGGFELTHIGLDRFRHVLFVDPFFVRTLLETLADMFWQVAVVIIYSLFIATLLNQKLKGKAFIRAVLFLPVILATGIIGAVQANVQFMTAGHVMSAETGDIGAMAFLNIVTMIRSLEFLGGITDMIFWAISRINTIIVSSGVQIIILLAGLQSIPKTVYEAAEVEGCSPWEAFWKITMPMISPLIPVCVVWTISDFFLNEANPVMTVIREQAFERVDYSLAAAMSLINLVAMGLLVSVTLFILNKMVFYENRPVKARKEKKKSRYAAFMAQD